MKKTQPVALVTGASSGIGQATAEVLAANGFTVFGTSRTGNQPVHSYQWLSLDVRSDASVEAAVKALLDQAGRIDVLVNNAGYAQIGAIEESSVADIQSQFETNLFGAIRMIQAVLPVMRQQGSGRIINVSSIVGHIAPPFVGVYSASKFALEGVSEALSEEVRSMGITVSLVEPAFVKTHIKGEFPTTPIAVYTEKRLASEQYLNASTAKGIQPEKVARVILRAATGQPQLRYLVGQDAQTLLLLKRVLPGALFERMLRRVFRTENSTQPGARTGSQNLA